MENVKEITQSEVAQAIYQGIGSCATYQEVDAFLRSQARRPSGERFKVVRHCDDALWYFMPEQMEEIRQFVTKTAESYIIA